MIEHPFVPGGPDGEAPAAAAHCWRAGCPDGGALRCGYVDRRGLRCPSAWCPRHRIAVDGVAFCRRHGGVVLALHADEAHSVPDIDNRAPSLVDWIGRDLDADIRRLLEESEMRTADCALVAAPVRLVFAVQQRTRTWERAWKLVDHTGVVVQVVIAVEERRDRAVVARVGRETVGGGVPPWIERRGASPETDAAGRRAFRDALLEAVAAGLRREAERRSLQRPVA